MQGVRTTRGCIHCRRKKKGCDLSLPACVRCIRLGLECRYEERRWMFVNQSNGLGAASPSPQQPPVTLSSVSRRSLTATNTKQQLEAEFWTLYLPREDSAQSGQIHGLLSVSWVSTARALGEEDSDVQTALQACAFAGLGWIRSDHTLVRSAGSLYANVLRQTNAALRSETRAMSDSVLACCRLLSMYEMFPRIATSGGGNSVSSPSPSTSNSSIARPAPRQNSQVVDWRSHVDGMSRLVELRGRDRHLSVRGRNLYDGVRMTAINQGLARRTPNALTDLPWSLPRLTPRDELYDLAAIAPGLMLRMDGMSTRLAACPARGAGEFECSDAESPNREELEDLFQRGLALCHGLHEWEDRLIGLCNTAHGKDVTNPGEINTDDFSLASKCKRHGLGFFSICIQYWAVCTVFYNVFQRFYHETIAPPSSPVLASLSLSTSPEPQSAQPTLPSWANPEAYALTITSHVEFLFRPDASLWAAQSGVFPISMALSYFARSGKMHSSSTSVGSMIGALTSSRFGRVMHGFLVNIREDATARR